MCLGVDMSCIDMLLGFVVYLLVSLKVVNLLVVD